MARLRDARGLDSHDHVCEADSRLLPPGDERATAAVAMASVRVAVSHAKGAPPASRTASSPPHERTPSARARGHLLSCAKMDTSSLDSCETLSRALGEPSFIGRNREGR